MRQLFDFDNSLNEEVQDSSVMLVPKETMDDKIEFLKQFDEYWDFEKNFKYNSTFDTTFKKVSKEVGLDKDQMIDVMRELIGTIVGDAAEAIGLNWKIINDGRYLFGFYKKDNDNMPVLVVPYEFKFSNVKDKLLDWLAKEKKGDKKKPKLQLIESLAKNAVDKFKKQNKDKKFLESIGYISEETFNEVIKQYIDTSNIKISDWEEFDVLDIDKYVIEPFLSSWMFPLFCHKRYDRGILSSRFSVTIGLSFRYENGKINLEILEYPCDGADRVSYPIEDFEVEKILGDKECTMASTRHLVKILEYARENESLLMSVYNPQKIEKILTDSGSSIQKIVNTKYEARERLKDFLVRHFDDIEGKGEIVESFDFDSQKHNLGLNKKAKQKHSNVDTIDNINDYVDLGLPSGNLWSKHNVGAENEEDYGEYFEFDDANNKYVLPSDDDYKELINNCTCKYDYPRNGLIFISIVNKESIFFPFSGYISLPDGDDYGKDAYAYYWSNTKDEHQRGYAFYINFGCAAHNGNKINVECQKNPIRTIIRRNKVNENINLGLNQKAKVKHDKVDPIKNLDVEFVDLGLPSGILWKTCNVGAKTPYEFGDYIQYDDCLASSKNGEIIPTSYNYKELIEHCSHRWDDANHGVWLTSNTNGNEIFFPAGGFFFKSTTQICTDKNEAGYYWTCSDDQNMTKGQCFAFDNIFIEVSQMLRQSCDCVRTIKIGTLHENLNEDKVNLGLNNKAKKKFNDAEAISNITDLTSIDDVVTYIKNNTKDLAEEYQKLTGAPLIKEIKIMDDKVALIFDWDKSGYWAKICFNGFDRDHTEHSGIDIEYSGFDIGIGYLYKQHNPEKRKLSGDTSSYLALFVTDKFISEELVKRHQDCCMNYDKYKESYSYPDFGSAKDSDTINQEVIDDIVLLMKEKLDIMKLSYKDRP